MEAVGTEEIEDNKTERFVWVDRDGAARRVVVQVGQSDDRWEEITEGLKDGDRVITGPAKLLRGLVDGDRIAAREAEDKGKADADSAGADGGAEGDDEAAAE